MAKSLVGKGAGGEDVNEQHLGTLGGLNISYDKVSGETKHLRLIT